MCDVVDQHALDPLEEDEWALDTTVIRGFVDGARAAIERSASAARLQPVRSSFVRRKR